MAKECVKGEDARKSSTLSMLNERKFTSSTTRPGSATSRMASMLICENWYLHGATYVRDDARDVYVLFKKLFKSTHKVSSAAACSDVSGDNAWRATNRKAWS